MEKRLFYKTIVKYEVLSEEPIPGHVDLEYIAKEAQEGRYVGRFLDPGPNGQIPLNGAAMADALREAGSEPSFFELDSEGNDFDENDPERDFDFEKDDGPSFNGVGTDEIAEDDEDGEGFGSGSEVL